MSPQLQCHLRKMTPSKKPLTWTSSMIRFTGGLLTHHVRLTRKPWGPAVLESLLTQGQLRALWAQGRPQARHFGFLESLRQNFPSSLKSPSGLLFGPQSGLRKSTKEALRQGGGCLLRSRGLPSALLPPDLCGVLAGALSCLESASLRPCSPQEGLWLSCKACFKNSN